MPIYEYRCTECDHTFEVIQKFNEEALRSCSACSGALEKLVSRTSFQLKGGGWYVHDYGSPKPSVSTDKKQDSASDTASSSKPSGGCSTGPCACSS